MLNILRPIEILKEIEKERNDKFYIAGSGIREYLIADKIKRIRIFICFFSSCGIISILRFYNYQFNLYWRNYYAKTAREN